MTQKMLVQRADVTMYKQLREKTLMQMVQKYTLFIDFRNNTKLEENVK